MERIYRKHMDNQLDIYLFSAQLMGGGEIEDIAQSAEILANCLKRSLTAVPIFWKPFVIFIAALKYTYNENYIWFSGHCFRVGGTPKQRTV